MPVPHLTRAQWILSALAIFISWALLTDYLPSLRWVPHAFLLGCLSTVGGGLYVITTTSRGCRDEGERGGYVDYRAMQPLFSADESVWAAKKEELTSRSEYRRPIIFPEKRGFSRAVDGFLDLVLRDHVTSWYAAISPRPRFQHEIDRVIRSVLLTIAARFTEIDVVEVSVARLLPLFTAHLKDFYEAERAVRGKADAVTESEEVDEAVARKFKGGRVHAVALASEGGVEGYLRARLGKLLPVVLPGNMLTSRAVTVLVREIVACAVLGPVLQMFCDPDFWNQQIVAFGGPMLRDRKTVKRVRRALDQHATGAAPSGHQFPRLRPYNGEKQFERFIRAIRHVMSLSEARRVRSEVVRQIRRDSQVEGQDQVYLRRLETGKRLLEQKIATISATVGANGSNGAASKPKLSVRTMSDAGGDAVTRKQQATLREIIYDAAGLSYFMEYMDRVKLMRLVQFYLVVDGFRYPLEGDDDEPPPGVAEDADRMDVAQMYEGYLSRPEFEGRVASGDLETVKRYLKQSRQGKEEDDDYVEARRAVLKTQTRVHGFMKDVHLDAFKRSDLFYKWLSIDDPPSARGAQNKTLSLSPDGLLSPESTSPVKSRRPVPGGMRKEPELRRAVLSSTDLKSAGRMQLPGTGVRRSLDDTAARPALFEDDIEGERMTASLGSLRGDESDGESTHQREEAEVVREMQTALDEIVSHEQDGDSLFSSESARPSLDAEASRKSQDSHLSARPPISASSSESAKPSIASLGLVGGPSNHGVFVDDLFADETPRFAEDEVSTSEQPASDDSNDEGHIREAAPGDLGLIEAIDTLQAEISKLNNQKSVLDSLTAKAELTNNAAELRILRKSLDSLQREIRRKELQKRQYIAQEPTNSLSSRHTSLTIPRVLIGREPDTGHEYAVYVVEVRRAADGDLPAATWEVRRRYSQFHDLHKRLRARFAGVKELDFPRRQALFTLQRDFVEKRRRTLERYLRSLLESAAICRSRELRAFLSQSAITGVGQQPGEGDQSKDFVSRIYESVSDGMEEFLGNIPVLDSLSVAGQNLITAAAAQMGGSVAASGGTAGVAAIDALDPAAQNPGTAAEAEKELNAYEGKNAAAAAVEEPFVKPICDLFLETFELSKGNSWLRGRTVVVVLHQLLGGTIERRVRDGAKDALQDKSLARLVEMVRETMWPDGQPRSAAPTRTRAEKERTRKEAGLLLGALVPDLAGSVVGRGNAVAAARKMGAVLNNRRLK